MKSVEEMLDEAALSTAYDSGYMDAKLEAANWIRNIVSGRYGHRVSNESTWLALAEDLENQAEPS